MEKWNIPGWTLVIIFIAWILISGGKEKNDLLKNGIIVNARVVDVALGAQGLNSDLVCEFEYKGQRYKTSCPSTYCGNASSLIGKIFPAVFAPVSRDFEVLITRDDFMKFNMACPDSMRSTIENTAAAVYR